MVNWLAGLIGAATLFASVFAYGTHVGYGWREAKHKRDIQLIESLNKKRRAALRKELETANAHYAKVEARNAELEKLAGAAPIRGDCAVDDSGLLNVLSRIR